MAWQQSSSDGGPGELRSWPTVLPHDRYAQFDAAIDAAMARRERHTVLQAEIEDLVGRMQRRIVTDRYRLYAPQLPSLRDLAAGARHILQRLRGQDPGPWRSPLERAEERAEKQSAKQAKDSELLAAKEIELQRLGDAPGEFRRAVFSKAQRIVDDRAEGWRQVADRRNTAQSAADFADRLDRADAALASLTDVCARARAAYLNVRNLRHPVDGELRDELITTAIAATDAMREGVENAQEALQTASLFGQATTLAPRRPLVLHRARGAFAEPVEAQILNLLLEAQWLQTMIESVVPEVESAQDRASITCDEAVHALLTLVKRPH
ncbi:MAG: hypothetical protein Q4G67_03270 [Actinomycetia bacterium]|nr:hypothetical protein [Actinomycetes bacterium]